MCVYCAQKERAVSDDDSKVEVWNKVLRGALSLPGARIDRASYLRKELSKYFSEEVVRKAIETTPRTAGISAEAIRSLAQSSIAWHRAGVSATSFAAGIPGGFAMAGTIPADVTQFFWHVLVILQKLAYLHGWPELFEDGNEPDDETLLLFTVFVGAMFGAEAASKLLADLAERISIEVAKRLPRQALTKWGAYNLAKQVAKWIGIGLTKDTLAKGLSKVVPVLGGVISGAVTWTTFSVMTSRLRKHLETLRPHNGSA
jgi:hypothetical protein